ncbi:MAG: pilus assembly protein [Acidobacteriales bacterium]|nr:pilus assembly protein [Candidatus Koribacter versatilis]MBI3645075.1 pilus assembly protein [Terriglobales bacterium]
MRRLSALANRTEGSALLEFAIVLPLLVVFVVGIYDFSGAYNQKQKIAHAAQAGAIVAGGQPTGDMYIDPLPNPDPESLQPVVSVIFNSLAADGVLPLANQGTCAVPVTPTPNGGLSWTYTISGCWSYPTDATPGCLNDPADKLRIEIDRGWVPTEATPPVTVGTQVTVSYPYHWRFNSAIQLLFPGPGYSAKTCLSETATVHNQM